jgi:hypothetical protein
MTSVISIGPFEIQAKERKRFISGNLWQEWVKKYPDIFDDDDHHLVQSQAHLGYHFYEWQAAVLLYKKMGYLSLVEKYQFKKHKRKQDIFLKRVSSLPRLLDLIACRKEYGHGVQCPDLFVYKPHNLTDWFFCEVKGPKEKIRDIQEGYFHKIAEVSGKPVRLIQFNFV